MSPEKQRVAIAEACGWKRVSVYSWLGGVRTPKQWVDFDVLPDYLNDLNAMAEAEKALKEKGDYQLLNTYAGKVCDVLDGEIKGRELACEPDVIGFEFLHATASQRAEAFLKTIGKWES